MNWEALGAIGEIVGAAGVILTLLYLATQMRHNTSALRSATYESWSRAGSDIHDLPPQHATDFVEIYQKNSLEELTPKEGVMFYHFAYKMFMMMETTFLHYRSGALEEDIFNATHRWFSPHGDEVGVVPCYLASYSGIRLYAGLQRVLRASGTRIGHGGRI